MAALIVDVVMPTYNHARFLAQAIESVLAQKTTFQYRLIVGDDCSTDGTQAIARSYAERHPDKIEILSSRTNLGALHRDRIVVKALKHCTAKYVAILEGDDYWMDSYKLQKQVDFLEGHPDCAVSFHDAMMFYEDGSAASRRLFPADQKEISTLEDTIRSGVFPIPCTILFRNKLLGELPESFYNVLNADWMLIVLLAQHGNLGYLNEVMSAYRVHSGGLWSQLNLTERIKEQIKTYETINAHLCFKFNQVICDRIADLPKYLLREHARACLDQYHRLAQKGEIKKGLRLLLEATYSAPVEVLRPRRLGAVLKNGVFGTLRKKGVQN